MTWKTRRMSCIRYILYLLTKLHTRISQSITHSTYPLTLVSNFCFQLEIKELTDALATAALQAQAEKGAFCVALLAPSLSLPLFFAFRSLYTRTKADATFYPLTCTLFRIANYQDDDTSRKVLNISTIPRTYHISHFLLRGIFFPLSFLKPSFIDMNARAHRQYGGSHLYHPMEFHWHTCALI